MKIETKSVSVSFNQKKILEDITTDIKDKEFVGIIGPNGSGKSTFLKCVYRVLKPNAGKIWLNGKSLEELSFRESALKLAVVAQHNYLNFDFVVLDIVLMGRTPHKKILERDNLEDFTLAREALKVVGLEGFEQRSFTTLSGGEQQRVILARALTQKTECLVLDEPTNHLDIKYQLQILDIVKKLDLTVVAAMHDLNMAAMYCDRLIALREGKIVGVGTPTELLTSKFIYELYGVEAKVELIGGTNLQNIIFMPQHLTGKAVGETT